jgi:hypothetical protein
MSKRLERLAPLITGVLMIVFAVIGVYKDGSRTGVSDTASGPQVLAYFRAHYTRMGGAGFSFLLAAVFGTFFYGFVRTHLSRSPQGKSAAVIGFGGALILATAALLEAGVDYAFNDVGTHLDAGTAQVLNILQSDLNVFFIQGGLCILMLGFGIAMLRGRSMSPWLGWATVVIGILAAAGPLVSVATPLEGVWILAMGVALLIHKTNASLPAGDHSEPLATAATAPGI